MDFRTKREKIESAIHGKNCKYYDKLSEENKIDIDMMAKKCITRALLSCALRHEKYRQMGIL
jgi:hypothetical protein